MQQVFLRYKCIFRYHFIYSTSFEGPLFMEHLIMIHFLLSSRKNIRSFSCYYLHFYFTYHSSTYICVFSVPEEKLFGSETDWYCQHVTQLVDTMRRQFYATGDLFRTGFHLEAGRVHMHFPTTDFCARTFWSVIFFLLFLWKL